MNKSSLKTFAIWGRNELRENVRIKLEILGIDEKGIMEGDIHNNLVSINGFEYNKGQYDSLVKKYNDLGYSELVEEVAYTWFNRLTALAYMEINEYSDDRLIYSTTSKIEPDILDKYMDTDFFGELSQNRKNMIHDLKDTHKLEEMYSILVEEKCHELSKIMPFMFEKSSDYTELLFPSGLLLEDSFLVRLREEIEESVEEIDGEKRVPVELIGWLYQFYNSEKKDEVFEGLKKNEKITKENIPAATQLFTPKWIVKYMAENSLGKLAVEHLGVSEELKKGWKYYIEAENREEIREKTLPSDGFPPVRETEVGFGSREKKEKLAIEDIKILDPAMGSGHMLTYSFDLLFDIYEDLGWSSKEAVLSILKNNIYGLEIDDRAGMLASFAIMMKAREKFRRLFRVLGRLDEEEKITLNTLAIQESNGIGKQTINLVESCQLENLQLLIENFKDAKEYGSILKIEDRDESEYKEEINKLKEIYKEQGQMGLFGGVWNFQEDLELLERLIHQGQVMSSKYDVTITNPPYMGGKGYSPTLKKYVEKNYKDSKADLFAVFIEKCGEYTKKNRYTAMITMHSWMFLSSFEKLRTKLIETKKIDTMLHLGTRAFEEIGGEVVQTTAWVTKNNLVTNDTNYHESKGTFVKLVDYNNSQWKQEEFKNKENYFQTSQKDFSKIPGSPIAYWVSDKMKQNFNEKSLGDCLEIRSGIMTGNDDLFLRRWYEIDIQNIGFGLKEADEILSLDKKWFPTNKEGESRKWHGQYTYVLEFQGEGKKFKSPENKFNFRLRDRKYYLKKGVSWGDITSGYPSFRYDNGGLLFAARGPMIFEEKKYLVGLLNSKISHEILQLINPTMAFNLNELYRIPLKTIEVKNNRLIDILVNDNLNISCIEWDSKETSWDFTVNPLIESYKVKVESEKDNNYPLATDNFQLEKSVEQYESTWRDRFFTMHSNEEELNRLFIEIYGLENEMDEKVGLQDITLLKRETSLDPSSDVSLCKKETSRDNLEELSQAEIEQGKRLVFDRSELVKQFLSYAVGCIMGRYSIDKPGLVIANSDDKLTISNEQLTITGADGEERHTIENPRFIMDAFGVIPVTGERVFDNDIVTRIEEFVNTVYGSENLNENLEFIATHLGIKKGESPRECIRRYFIKDFYKDHLQRYKKRPIYWMVNSGKKEGFSALIYMHRYRDNTVGRIRADYLNRYQEVLENILDSDMKRLGDGDIKPKDKKVIEREIKTINGQLDELRKFAMDVKDIADRKIGIDLDDGVKVNYAKFGKILKKI